MYRTYRLPLLRAGMLPPPPPRVLQVGPLIGGVLCELFGWRSTFWFCAIVDGMLFVISLFYVPETITTPVERRPVFNFKSPFVPLTELKNKEVGLLCLLGGVNHSTECTAVASIFASRCYIVAGSLVDSFKTMICAKQSRLSQVLCCLFRAGLIYAPAVLGPAIMSLLTNNEFVIGLMMLPVISGTIVGSKIAGKLAKPKRVIPLTAAQKAARKTWDCQSFLRTFFPWSMVRADG